MINDIKKENTREKKIQQRAEILQKECHMFVSAVKEESNASHQDVTNVWIFRKLAELEINIARLQLKDM